MLKVIVAATNKGGDGKTKTSILLSEFFSQVKNKRVLGIDFDPQCNYSNRFLEMEIDSVAEQGKMPPIHPDYDPNDPEDAGWDGRSTIANIFYGKQVFPYPTHIPNLDMAPAHALLLQEAEQVRKSEVTEKVHNRLRLFLADPALQDYYDLIIIDTPPSKGPLTVSAIRAATHMVIPAVMEQNSIEGIYGMLQLWKQESLHRERSNPLELIGILPNKVRDINLHRDNLGELSIAPYISEYVLPYKLKQRSVYAEVDSEDASPRTIFDLPPSNVAKAEALAVCEFINEKVFTHDQTEEVRDIEGVN